MTDISTHTPPRTLKSTSDVSNPEPVTRADEASAMPETTPAADDSKLISMTRQGSDGKIQLPPSARVNRHSSLRFDSTLAKSRHKSAGLSTLQPLDAFETSRPLSHPASRYAYKTRTFPTSSNERGPLTAIPQGEVWPSSPIQPPLSPSSNSQLSTPGTKPRPSFARLSSLDNLITYREERAKWERAASIRSTLTSESEGDILGRMATSTSAPVLDQSPETANEQDPSISSKSGSMYSVSGNASLELAAPPPSIAEVDPQFRRSQTRFRHIIAEIGFCFTIAMTQFLAEYMISGFAIELPRIIERYSSHNEGDASDTGTFWPASLLSLILSATLLIFARISDMYGGYLPFLFGVVWLGIWSSVAGFAGLGTLLDIARAMQGLAIAAFTPATFAMVGSIYPEGPRKNLVLGLYSGCAPLGFFAGFLVTGSLPYGAESWYFWIAAVLSSITVLTAYLTVPHDRTDRRQLGLKMDWVGAFLIMAGLILVSYALAVEPYANAADRTRSGWSFPMVLGPLLSGLVCLVAAFWVEGWLVPCPLLPFDFFRPKSVKMFALACMCFYASYGVWLYESAQFFRSESTTGVEGGIQGVALAAWYTPTAVGGLILCVAGGALLHVIPIMGILFVSALAWIAAPLLLALCPLPVSYWAFVMPSMLCATLGIDLTFTVSAVFLSSVQPLRYQGLAGAVCSILVNLAMSFSLSISEIVSESAKSSIQLPDLSSAEYNAVAAQREIWGFQAAFVYAAASAGLGLVICTLFVRISRAAVQEKATGDPLTRASSLASTVVEV